MTSTTRWRRVKALTATVAGAVLLSGCQFDIYALPLPGGTDTGDDPIVVEAMFADVLDLVPKSSVKVNDVSVGQVTDIALDGQVARVTMELQSDVELPDNAVAELRQTSLLGEKFVSLAPPEEGASDEPLESGDTIDLDRTGRNPEVEEVLGALSLLLNGGGVAQLKTIASELNTALEGREGSAKSVFRQIEELTGQLDDNKDDIVRAIEALNRLSIAVNDQTGSIDLALEELPSALTSLDQQRDDLVRMLRALNRLGDVGVRVIKASKRATIESFRQLLPTLTEIANSGQDFVNAFHVFLTYPFVDEVVGRDPQVARRLDMGDFTNLSIQMDLTINDEDGPPTLPTNPPTILDPTEILDKVAKCLQSGSLESKACQKVLKNLEALTELREECQKPENEDKDVCKQLNTVPGLPTPSSTGGGAGLPNLPNVPGLPRAGFGPVADWDRERGPTLRQLTKVYDPALVALLVPGMVMAR